MESPVDQLLQQLQQERINQITNETAIDVLLPAEDPGDVEDGCDFAKSSPNWPFNQLSVDYSVLGCAEIEVVDISQLTAVSFYRRYVSKNIPVIISGAIDNWEAFKTWNDNTMLTQSVGTDTVVSVDFTPDGRADAIVCNGNYPPIQAVQTTATTTTTPANTSSLPSGLYSDIFAIPHTHKMPFGDFVKQISSFPEMVYNHPHRSLEEEYSQALTRYPAQSTQPEGELPPSSTLPGVPYCQRQNDNFTDEFTSLHKQVLSRGFQWANECFESEPLAVNFWMGSSFSHTSLHQDWFENIYAVLDGEKHFVLIPPSEVYWLPKKQLPTVRWVPIENVTSSSLTTESSSPSSSSPSSPQTIVLQTNDKGQTYFDWTFDSAVPLPSIPTLFPTSIYSQSSYSTWRFFVVDRGQKGDNCEYHNLDDLLDEAVAKAEQDKAKSSIDHLDPEVHDPSIQEILAEAASKNPNVDTENVQVLNDLAALDFGHQHHPYIISSTSSYVAADTSCDEKSTATATTSTTASAEIPIFPLIMVKKGHYVTIPVLNEMALETSQSSEQTDQIPRPTPTTQVSIITELEEEEAMAQASTQEQQSSLNEHQSEKPSEEDLIKEYIHQYVQITPWIDIDPEINPVNFTPGSQRTKHQNTNSHIVRYIAKVKKGQVLYLPRQWYHTVRQTGKTISLNYWYDMEYDGHFVLHEFIRRVAEKAHQQQSENN